MSSRFFNDEYRRTPPWDIGRPQPEFVRVAETGEVRGAVLDVGCGTGEHAIYFASRGHPALGVDSAPLAIEKAKEKARQRRSSAEFRVADALDLGHLGKTFDAAIDSGLFHTLDDDERTLYAQSVSSALNSLGNLFVLAFSDREPPGWGPRRVSNQEIVDSFGRGWKVNYIRPAVFETRLGSEPAKATMASMTKL